MNKECCNKKKKKTFLRVCSLCSSNIVVISKNLIRSKIVVILKYRSVKLSKLQQSIFNLENTSMIGSYVFFFFFKLFTIYFICYYNLKTIVNSKNFFL